MSIFSKIVADEYTSDTHLGMPSNDEGHFERRKNAMSAMRGGNGFRKPAKVPAVRANGKTRSEIKRAARDAANAWVSERRDPQFMHSSARLRAVATTKVAA